MTRPLLVYSNSNTISSNSFIASIPSCSPSSLSSKLSDGDARCSGESDNVYSDDETLGDDSKVKVDDGVMNIESGSSSEYLNLVDDSNIFESDMENLRVFRERNNTKMKMTGLDYEDDIINDNGFLQTYVDESSWKEGKSDNNMIMIDLKGMIGVTNNGNVVDTAGRGVTQKTHVFQEQRSNVQRSGNSGYCMEHVLQPLDHDDEEVVAYSMVTNDDKKTEQRQYVKINLVAKVEEKGKTQTKHIVNIDENMQDTNNVYEDVIFTSSKKEHVTQVLEDFDQLGPKHDVSTNAQDIYKYGNFDNVQIQHDKEDAAARKEKLRLQPNQEFRLQQQKQQRHVLLNDDFRKEYGTEYTDNGLGCIPSNLPSYLSDAELPEEDIGAHNVGDEDTTGVTLHRHDDFNKNNSVATSHLNLSPMSLSQQDMTHSYLYQFHHSQQQHHCSKNIIPNLYTPYLLYPHLYTLNPFTIGSMTTQSQHCGQERYNFHQPDPYAAACFSAAATYQIRQQQQGMFHLSPTVYGSSGPPCDNSTPITYMSRHTTTGPNMFRDGTTATHLGPVMGTSWDGGRNNFSRHRGANSMHLGKVSGKVMVRDITVTRSHEVDGIMRDVAPPALDKVISLSASRTITFDSIQKIAFVMTIVMTICYCAVSPRSMPLVEYNMQFKENARILSIACILPILTLFSMFEAKENDINVVIATFFTSFTFGYIISFVFEIFMTTVLRLGVFYFMEPSIFSLTPKIPLVILPWTLREHRYRPRRITLFVADFATSCMAAPIIEEVVKLSVVQMSARLPRNFHSVKRNHYALNGDKRRNNNTTKRKERKICIKELLPRNCGEPEITNINVYVTEMFAASLGIKLCDITRRILMYTKKDNSNKYFYAILRGIFPIHELCGTMTALELAKRDVLGVDIPLWRVLAPAIFIHGMANFRGMKPIFKWNSSTPWSEVQLSPWNTKEESTLIQLLQTKCVQLMWLTVLGRLLGYCVKNYYLIGRQAVKRTTTYAGRKSAFSAELETAEMLKKSKKEIRPFL